VNVGTLGIGGPVASVVEDTGAVTLAVLAILAPLAAIVGAAVLVGLIVVLAIRLGAKRRRPPNILPTA
jgi:hypothetical protein